jgi:SAM-dependent methyltransferase
MAEEGDAFGQALVDHLEGRTGALLYLEADDGSSRPADLQPADFFRPRRDWARWERRLVARATGRVLDLGAGAGRVAIPLQDESHDVTAVDISPGAVDVCRRRGLSDVRQLDIRAALPNGTWDTVLLMCGNLGLGGDWDPTKDLLKRIANVVPHGGRLIGDSVDPTSDDPDDLAYEARNERNGYHRGHVRLRLRYGNLCTPWWDQLNIPRDDLPALVDGTGWTLEDESDADVGYGVILRRVGN